MTDALVEAVARGLGQRFIDRGNARVTGSPYGCWEEMPGSYTRDFFQDATAALQAIEAAGYRVVPVEATRKMRLAGEKEMMARHTNLDCFRDPYVDSTYAAMLSAAPRVGEGV